jgi:hypothetical protein
MNGGEIHTHKTSVLHGRDWFADFDIEDPELGEHLNEILGEMAVRCPLAAVTRETDIGRSTGMKTSAVVVWTGRPSAAPTGT